MVDYRRMGNMEQRLGNITWTTLLHELRDLWNSPRGTVLRIQALTLVAITFTFFLAVFGSCRRWSNRWIVQKGFLAAQVLSLSLGTYSIGLMQSSWVKSEMYPIWAVSLLTLFGCVDPVTTYNGLDYKGPIMKVIFQLCLYCGYVLLMSTSTISSAIGNLAIGMLTTITFIKGFHRSLALVLQMKSRNRSEIGKLFFAEPLSLAVVEPFTFEVSDAYRGHFKRYKYFLRTNVPDMLTYDDETIIEDALIGYCLSYLLRRRFFGMDRDWEMAEKREQLEGLVRNGRVINYKRTLKAIEVELVFLYDVFFTSNEFLHFYEAKASRFWAFGSLIGICFVGVATIPGTISSTSFGPDANSIVVNTTTADLVITLIILVSLALLQLVELIRCWTSNWGKIIFACKFNTRDNNIVLPSYSLGMRLLTMTTWFDMYLWQDKLGQYSLLAPSSRRNKCCQCVSVIRETKRILDCICFRCGCVPVYLSRMLGLKYIGQVLWELWGSNNNGGPGVRLDDAVKTSIADFLGQIKSTRIGVEWYSLFDANGIDASDLPYSNTPLLHTPGDAMSDAYMFAYRVMVWHIATWYCEEQEQDGSAGGSYRREKNRHVATALSKYCAYLVVSAPELLPSPSAEIQRAFDHAVEETSRSVTNMTPENIDSKSSVDAFKMGVYWGKRLRNEVSPPPECPRLRSDDPWKVLALLWVQTLLYAAPYGDVQAHLQHLSQGGEFITHLWALLYHIGIDKWEHAPAQETEQEEATGASGERLQRQD